MQGYSLENLKSSKQFIVLVGDNQFKTGVMFAWDIDTFEEYSYEFSKAKYS